MKFYEKFWEDKELVMHIDGIANIIQNKTNYIVIEIASEIDSFIFWKYLTWNTKIKNL